MLNSKSCALIYSLQKVFMRVISIYVQTLKAIEEAIRIIVDDLVKSYVYYLKTKKKRIN